MTNKKIIIAGGSGFIGEEMIRYFGKTNELVILTRKVKASKNNRNHYSGLTEADLSNIRFVEWDGKTVGNWKEE
jgi:uncharacterized protein